MTYCFMTDVIGDGSAHDPYRPSVPPDVSFDVVYLEPTDPRCRITTDTDISYWPSVVPCDPPPTPEEPV